MIYRKLKTQEMHNILDSMKGDFSPELGEKLEKDYSELNSLFICRNNCHITTDMLLESFGISEIPTDSGMEKIDRSKHNNLSLFKGMLEEGRETAPNVYAVHWSNTPEEYVSGHSWVIFQDKDSTMTHLQSNAGEYNLSDWLSEESNLTRKHSCEAHKKFGKGQ